MNELTDVVRAKDLDRRIKVSAQLAQQSLYEMCTAIKEMRDTKLYKELGYQNFEEYCEKEVGIKRHMAQKYIAVAEMENGESIHHLGVTKCALLAQLDEPTRTEIIENTDLENTTVRELKGRIKSLEQQADNAQAIADKLTKSENKAWGEVSKLKTDNEARQERIAQLEREIKELESRPIEMVAAPPDSDEVRRLKQAMSNLSLQVQEDEARRDMEEKEFRDSFRAKMEADRDSAIAEYEAKRSAELEALKKELEQAKAQLSETPSAEDKDKQDFKALLTNAVDSVKRLNDFVKAHDNETFRQKLNQLAAMIGG